MSYELHHSGIITGCVNYFCLACDSSLKDSQEAFRHTIRSSHRERLSAVPYLDKFQDQYIRKFTTGYYCEFCNKLMQTAVHVNLHLCEEYHLQNRGTELLKSSGRDVIAFNNSLIEERAWHGLIEKVCVICVTEFEDEDLHRSNTGHVLSLIQRPVKFGVNDVIYRPIDDSSYHCLTCNKLLPLNTMSKHFEQADHIDRHLKSIMTSENHKNIDEENTNENVVDRLLLHDTEIESNGLENNDTAESVTADKCKIDIQFDQRDIERHTKESLCKNAFSSIECDPDKADKSKYIITSENNDLLDVNILENGNPEKEEMPQIRQSDVTCKAVNNIINKKNDALESSSSKFNPGSNNYNLNTPEAIETISIDNNITYNSNANNAYCRTCEVKLPSNLISLQEHIKGVPHNKKLLATLTRQRISEFVQGLSRVQKRSEMEINSGYIINDQYYIGLFSFLLLTIDTPGVSYKCLLCGAILPEYPQVPVTHIDNCCLPKGKEVQIITSLKDEFVREIRPATFHCGFCHTVVSGWSEMQRHLRSTEHELQKSDSYDRFRKISYNIRLNSLRKYIRVIELNYEAEAKNIN